MQSLFRGISGPYKNETLAAEVSELCNLLSHWDDQVVIESFCGVLTSPLLKSKSDEIQYHFITRSIDEYIPAAYARIALAAVENSQMTGGLAWSHDFQEKYSEFLARYAPFDFEELLAKIGTVEEQKLIQEEQESLERQQFLQNPRTLKSQFLEILEIFATSDPQPASVGGLLNSLRAAGKLPASKNRLSQFIDHAFGVPDYTQRKIDVFRSFFEKKEIDRLSWFKQYDFVVKALADRDCIPLENLQEAIQIVKESETYDKWFSGFKIHLENFIENDLDWNEFPVSQPQAGFWNLLFRHI